VTGHIISPVPLLAFLSPPDFILFGWADRSMVGTFGRPGRFLGRFRPSWGLPDRFLAPERFIRTAWRSETVVHGVKPVFKPDPFRL
jgi:hypothetical protein